MTSSTHKKIIYIAISYVSIIEYLILLSLLSWLLDVHENPFLSLIISGVPGVISIIISRMIYKKNLLNNQSKEILMFKLSAAQIPAIFGLIGALLYLFVF